MEYIEFINKDIYNTILDGINRETHNSIPQCYYVSGDMGYGKTNLLHQLGNTINNNLFQPIYIDCILNPIANEEKLEEIRGFCIIPWIKMLNYTSISTKLS